MLKDELRLPPEKLRRTFNPESFVFQNTSEVEPIKGFIGQDRAVQALRQGLEIDNHEYNVFVISDTSISRGSVLLKYLDGFVQERAAAGDVLLRDFCFIYNFEKPDCPTVLFFKKGGGREFKQQIEAIPKVLQDKIPAIFQSEEYVKVKDEIEEKTNTATQKKREFLIKRVRERGFVRVPTQAGYYDIYPVSKKPVDQGSDPTMTLEEYDDLPEEERESLDKYRAILLRDAQKISQEVQNLQREANQKIEKLEKRSVGKLLGPIYKDIRRRHQDYPEVLNYSKRLIGYAANNINLFKSKLEEERKGNGIDYFLPFAINLFVDNAATQKIPVIFESNPNFGNIFGRIDRKPMQGSYYLLTDHTCLKAGSLSLAEGGYLVLNIIDVLKNPGVWEKLEKTIRYGYLKIEEPMSYLGLAQFSNLTPEPMPVKLKVILVGEPTLYQLLVQHDPEFSAIFKVKAEFDSEMLSTPENERAYAAFIALCCAGEDLRRNKDKLLPFDCPAVAKVIEYGLRLANKQTKLSAEFNKIKELIIESDYWAEKAGSEAVKAEHVKKALEARKLRANLSEEKVQESIRNGMLLIDTKGKEVGQINGLTVYDVGDYRFGRPKKITASTFLGSKGLISIEREVKLSGPFHDKGILAFQGYFGQQYAQDNPISFSASICFEQLYSGVEGDSASVAELICLISSLAEVPISQNLAVTGSINQKGEIQPIGGVNEKIEGFFDVCQERGLSGDQGVIIPYPNVQNLMLREDVVEACGRGEFNVYSIETIDQGLELLMDESAEEIHKKVASKLSVMAEKIKKAAPNLR